MGIFGNKDERKLSFSMGAYKFIADDKYLSYKSPYGKSFRVLRADIDGVSLEMGGRGKNIVKINGKGTLLAEVELPKPWAEKAQEFIQSEALNIKNQTMPSESEAIDLEKLAEYKAKGIITEEEFEKKKKEILGL